MSDSNNEKKVELLKDANAIAFKTLAKDKKLDVHYVPRSSQPFSAYKVDNQAKLPHPPLKPEDTDIDLLRGLSDSLAMRTRYHNPSQHNAFKPNTELGMELMNALERARYEGLGAEAMPGLGQNILKANEQVYKQKSFHQAIEQGDVPMSEALYNLALSHYAHVDPPETAQKLVDLWQNHLKQTITEETLSTLKDLIDQPDAYYQKAREIISQLDGSDFLQNPEVTEETNDQSADQPPEQQEEEKAPETQDDNDDGDEGLSEEQSLEEESVQPLGPQEDQDGDMIESDEAGEAPSGPDRINMSLDDEAHAASYHIYTDAFDEIVRAEELATTPELTRLRNVLDHQLSNRLNLVSKMANRLQRKLLSQQQRSWNFNLDDGQLDTKRFAEIIADPTKPARYKQEKSTEFKDTILSILIDNSGSMRGRPISIAAMSADILARTLERCGIKTEILGFTTRAWKGGRARQLWVEHEKSANPGRLNDLRHIIYKAADMPMRRARNNLGLMLKEGILKENIDGEALLWAYKRLSTRQEKRKILMVISDGAPVDDSTQSNNSALYLEQDLRSVIAWIEQHKNVELTAIGIGHDVTRYYKRAMMLSQVEDLGETMIGQLEELFDDKQPRMR